MSLRDMIDQGQNWDQGQKITLTPGQTATCTTLQQGQIYGIFAYNSSNAAMAAHLNVNWQLGVGKIVIPATTDGQGSSAMGFISGDDTTTISVSLSTAHQGEVTLWLGSVSMPINTQGIINKELPADGSSKSFGQCTRYYCTLSGRWYSLTLTSKVTQFISCRFTEKDATVYVLNQSCLLYTSPSPRDA